MIDIDFADIFSRLRQVSLEKVDLVVGIKEGGLIPAIMIAYHLNCDLELIRVRYRDQNNDPMFNEPQVDARDLIDLSGKKILLVDDVSVSGKTFKVAKKALERNDLKTFALKGDADYVLFPEIDECVNWPWK